MPKHTSSTSSASAPRDALAEIVPILTATARARDAREQRFARLWRMSAEERAAAMWRGELSLPECLAWSARHPDQVPLIGSELAYIAMHTPDWQDD